MAPAEAAAMWEALKAFTVGSTAEVNTFCFEQSEKVHFSPDSFLLVFKK